jgi:hypothetical protein
MRNAPPAFVQTPRPGGGPGSGEAGRMAEAATKGKPGVGYFTGGARLAATAGMASTDPASVGVTSLWLACS